MLNEVKVIVCGKEYKLRTAESPNYVFALARALEAKINGYTNGGGSSEPPSCVISKVTAFFCKCRYIHYISSFSIAVSITKQTIFSHTLLHYAEKSTILYCIAIC